MTASGNLVKQRAVLKMAVGNMVKLSHKFKTTHQESLSKKRQYSMMNLSGNIAKERAVFDYDPRQ